ICASGSEKLNTIEKGLNDIRQSINVEIDTLGQLAAQGDWVDFFDILTDDGLKAAAIEGIGEAGIESLAGLTGGLEDEALLSGDKALRDSIPPPENEVGTVGNIDDETSARRDDQALNLAENTDGNAVNSDAPPGAQQNDSDIIT